MLFNTFQVFKNTNLRKTQNIMVTTMLNFARSLLCTYSFSKKIKKTFIKFKRQLKLAHFKKLQLKNLKFLLFYEPCEKI